MDENGALGRQAEPINLELPFNLHDRETIQLVIKPDRARFLIKNLTITYILLAALLLPLAIPQLFPMQISIMGHKLQLFMIVPVLVVLAGLLSFIITNMLYHKLTFWITNSRIINESGFVGYTVRSIPIDVVSDITIHRGIFDILLDASDIRMPTVNDSIYNLYKHRSGINHIPSLNPGYAQEVQKLIFHVRDGRKLDETRIYREYFVT